MGAARRRRVVLVLTGLVVAIPAGVWAWDTDDSKGWESVYFAGSVHSDPPNEHTHLSVLVARRLGLESRLGNTGDAAVTVVDLNASVFRPAVGRGSRAGDNPRTPLEERRVPAPTHFAGLPDYSYTLYDWINKNTICPVLPPRAPRQELCHKFTGWMGAFNANHFGSQAEATYKRYHTIAVELARRAAYLRQTVEASGIPEEIALHDTTLREMEIEALVYEHIGQHYLQDRWAMGHMWERWNGADYSRMHPTFEMNFLVGAVSGLLHGSESVLRMATTAPDEWIGPVASLYSLAEDPMSSPAKRPTVNNPLGIEPARWTDRAGSLPPEDGVGDWRLASMLGGTFAGFPLNVGVQQSRMLDCLTAGVAEVIMAMGPSATSVGFGQHGFVLPGAPPTLGEHCYDQWATDDAIAMGLFGDDIVVWATTRGIDTVAATARAMGLGTLVNIVPQLIDIAATDVDANRLYRLYRQHVVVTGAQVWIRQIVNRVDPTGSRSTVLARGGLASFAFGAGRRADPGNAYGVAPWLEPADLNTLPLFDARTGRDKQSLFGFFSRSHLDYWAQNADSIFPTLRGSRDRTKQAACVFLAGLMYQRTPTGYSGGQKEFRSSDGSANGRELRSMSTVFGLVEETDRDGLPIVIAPGYVGGSERGEQRPFAARDGVLQTVHNWCAAIPVLDLWRGSTGVLSPEDLVAIGVAGEEITVTGLHLGRRKGQVELAGRQAEAQRPRIVSWTDSVIRLRLPEREYQSGDYRVRVRAADGRSSVGRFVLRLVDSEEAARLAAEQAAGDAAEAADVCTVQRADTIRQAVDQASYQYELEAKERELGWRREWRIAATARVTAAQDSLRRLSELRDRLLRRNEVASQGIADFDAEFRLRERRLADRIQGAKRSLRYLQTEGARDPQARWRAAQLERDITGMEAELVRRREMWLRGEGANEAAARRIVTQSIEENRRQIGELRWDIERAKLELTFSLESLRRLDADIADREADVARYRDAAPAYLRRLPPPWVTQVDGRRYRAHWVTEEAELERYDRAIAITDALIADLRQLIRNVESDIRRAERAFLDSDERWQYLHRRYGERVHWEAWSNIALELADSYENIFGVKSPAAAARANPIAVAGAAVVEAASRLASVRWGEPPSFDDPKLARELIETRQRLAGNPAAEAAAAFGLHTTAYLWTEEASGAGSGHLDSQGYPVLSSVARELSRPREHFKSQLQSAIEVWSTSPIRTEVRRGVYWSRAAMGARGLLDDIPANDPMWQAAAMYYASAGTQRELASASFRGMFSSGLVKSELRRLSASGFRTLGKDAVKAGLKEGVRELVQKGKLDAFLEAFEEELVYFAARREYHFFGALRQRELLDLEVLREIRQELLAERDRVLPGRLLRIERSDIFPTGSHSLTVTFSEPVENVAVSIDEASADSIVLAADGLSAQVQFSLNFESTPPASHAVMSVTAVATRTQKPLDGEPQSIACYLPRGTWQRYETGADATHRLRLAPAASASIVFLIDASRSMNQTLPSGVPRLDAAKKAVRRWFVSESLSPGSEVAVWAIRGGAPTRVLEFTTDTTEVLRAVDALTSSGGTPLARAIDAAGLYLLSFGSSERKALIILSDGEDSERGDYTASIARLRERSVDVRRQ